MKLKLISILITVLMIWGCGNTNDKNSIEESGTVETTTILISSERAGKISKINCDEGSNIKESDTLMILDYELLQIKLDQAKAAEKMAKANYELLKKGARSEDKKTASENLNQAKVKYSSAKKDYDRYSKLYKEKVITLKQFEDAESRLNICDAQLKSAEENYKKIKNLVRPEELLKVEAAYEQAQAKSEEVRKLIKDSYVIAPINGTIIKRYAEIGETVNPMSSLLKLADLSEAEIVIYIPETDLGRIKLGQKAEIESDTYPGKRYEGKVKFISSEAEFTPKNVQTKDERVKLVFAVKVFVKNTERELKSGMPVDVKIILDDNE